MKKLYQLYDSSLIRYVEILCGLLFNLAASMGIVVIPVVSYWYATQGDTNNVLLIGAFVIECGLLYRNHRMFGFMRKKLKKYNT